MAAKSRNQPLTDTEQRICLLAIVVYVNQSVVQRITDPVDKLGVANQIHEMQQELNQLLSQFSQDEHTALAVKLGGAP